MNQDEARNIFLQSLHELSEPLKSAVEFALSNWHKLSRESSKIDDLPHEEWRDVVGYEGLYQVSNYGRMKSLIWNGGRLINPCLHTGGYMLVGLYKNGKRKNHFVHVLVAKAFVPNPFIKPQVNHIDGDKTNNQVENLEWVTGSENSRHAQRIGLIKYEMGSTHKNSKLTAEQVRYIREHYIPYNHEFSSTALAKRFGVDGETILNVIHCKKYMDVV